MQKLFAGHNDLLYEFKYFLPDNAYQPPQTQSTYNTSVSATANRRAANINRKNKSITNRSRTQQNNNNDINQSSANKLKSQRLNNATQQQVITHSRVTKPTSLAGLPMKPKNIPQSTYTTVSGKLKKTVIYPSNSEKELAFFDRIKQWCEKKQWLQILKTLNLYSNDIITRPELIRIFSEILGDRPGSDDLLNKFKQLLQYDENEEKQLQHGSGGYYTYVSSVDLSSSAPITTSYRQIPSQVSIPACSGRTALGDSTLNDLYISIPTGSEDFSFKTSRRNIYEENLFRCEDERYELDMIIENNMSVIALLEPIYDSLQTMSTEQQKRFDIEPLLDMLHIRSISRIYGENAIDIIELLKLNPIQTIPVILQRMKQKNIEWRTIQHEMRLPWRRIFEQNYVRSLDHRSFYFKQEDKKRRLPKVLVQELREVHQQYFINTLAQTDDKSQHDVSITDYVTPLLRQVREGSAPAPVYNYCMRFVYADRDTHNDVLRIMMYVASKTLTSKDQYKILLLLTGFVYQFCGVDVTAEQQSQLQQLKIAADNEVVHADIPVVNNNNTTNNSNNTAIVDAMQVDSDNEASGNNGAQVPGTINEPVSSAKRSNNKSKSKKKAARTQPAVKRGKENVHSMSGSTQDDDDDKDADVEIDAQQKLESSDNDDDTVDNDPAQQQSPIRTSSRSGILPGTLSHSTAPHIEQIIDKLQSTLKHDYTNSHHIKPIRLALSTWQLQEKHSPIRQHTRSSQLFYASNALYVFFRLHQFLYERLSAAKQLSNKIRKHVKKSHATSKQPVTGDERWNRFLELVYELLDSKLEASKFEDECRNLLGASAYVLFNMDKLVAQLVKQSTSLLHNDTSLKLIALYQYELQRISTLPPIDPNNQQAKLQRSSECARMYLSNAASMLQNNSICQIEFFNDSNELCIGLVDDLYTPDNKNVSHEWAEWLEQYLGDTAKLSFNNTSNISQTFLLRNITQSAHTYANQLKIHKKSDVASVNLVDNTELYNELYNIATNNTHIYNNLECKIDTRTYKIYYVDETEDIFYRNNVRHNNINTSDGILRQRKFNEWLESRRSELPSLPVDVDVDNDADVNDEMLDDDEGAAALLSAVDAAVDNSDDNDENDNEQNDNDNDDEPIEQDDAANTLSSM